MRLALDAAVDHRAEALEREHLQEEARHDERPAVPGQRPQRAEQHLEELRVRLALQPELVGRLQHRHRARQAVEVVADRPEVVDRLGLVDDVELAATLVELQLQVGGRLEAGAEAALRLADALGDRPHLAVAPGEDADDAVGLAELVGPEHDALVPVQAHRRDATGRPRRSGGPGAGTRATASKRCSRRKSGHSVSVKISSL